MRRVGGLFEEATSFASLHAAYLRARRGKRHRASVDRFSLGLEGELLLLQRELRSGMYVPGPMRSFVVEDPKRRLIRAAPFRDRVVHHAIMGALGPHLDRWLDPDSFACREGKGLDAALRRAVALSRLATWVLKTDVEGFFASIDHEVLGSLRIKDRPLLELLGSFISHGAEAPGRGLPIGSLTSQWLANSYLSPLDRFVREELRPRGYIRYMDDFALMGRSRDAVRSWRRQLEAWLPEQLRLVLKENATHIHEITRGWPFLGFRVHRHGLEVRRQTLRLWKKRFQEAWHRHARGELTLEELVRSAECRLVHLSRARSEGLRRREVRGAEL